MPPSRFVPSAHSVPSDPLIDDPSELRDVLAIVAFPATGGTREVVIGLDLGRVIRVVPLNRQDEMSPRVRAQIEHHGVRMRPILDDAELYLLDVQAVERLPDEPGANDPLYIYGMLRGPYPQALDHGVVAVEGQFTTTRGALLHGLSVSTSMAFTTEGGASGTRCIHAMLPGDRMGESSQPSVVMAFPLVTMGEDATNELVAAQLYHDVLGALRTDLGDDLGKDPVPVASRKRYEQELVAGGWKIEGDHAVKKTGGRLASLFSPAKKQKLPVEATVDQFASLAIADCMRIEGWPLADVMQLRRQLRLDGTYSDTRAPEPMRPRQVPPAPPPSPPRAAQNKRKRPPTPLGVSAPTRPTREPKRDAPNAWIKVQVDQHRAPNRPAPMVTTPSRVHDASGLAEWMFEMITSGKDPTDKG